MSYALLKSFEGYRDKAYKDGGGVWTIGYGHIKGVKEGDTCTLQQADEWLQEDLYWVHQAINVGVHVPLTTNQREALVCLIFNIGGASFLKSTLLKKLNFGNTLGAADEFLRWNKDNGRIIPGLQHRREKERELFLNEHIE